MFPRYFLVQVVDGWVFALSQRHVCLKFAHPPKIHLLSSQSIECDGSCVLLNAG
jgi:hypothetical protein